MNAPFDLGREVEKANAAYFSRPARALRIYQRVTDDARDASLMRALEWARLNRELFGKSYRRGQFERAFAGCTPAEIRAVGGV